MTDTTLKSVFTLETESQTYKPAAHNLSAEQAVERFNNDQNAKIVDQGERHRTADPLKCKTCKKAAEELTSNLAQSQGLEQSEEELAAQGSESD